MTLLLATTATLSGCGSNTTTVMPAGETVPAARIGEE
jgi:uncharacterized protein YceK